MRKSLLLLLAFTSFCFGAKSNSLVVDNFANDPVVEHAYQSSFLSLNSSTNFGKFLRGMLLVDRAPGCENDIVVDVPTVSGTCSATMVTWTLPTPNDVVTTPTDTLFINLSAMPNDTIRPGDMGFQEIRDNLIATLPVGNYRIEYLYTVSTIGNLPGVCNVLINVNDAQGPTLDLTGIYTGPAMFSNDTITMRTTDTTCATGREPMQWINPAQILRPTVLDLCDASSLVGFTIEDAMGNILASDDTLTVAEANLLGSLQDTIIFPLGFNYIIFNGYDTLGNTTLDSLVINIVDQTAPIFDDTLKFPMNMMMVGVDSVSTDLGLPTASVSYLIPNASDFCSAVNYSFLIRRPVPVVSADTLVTGTGNNIDANLPIGTFELQYAAADVAGNTTTLTFNIVVEDNEAPTVVCPNDEFDGPYEVTQNDCEIMFSTESVSPADNVSSNLRTFWEVLDTDTSTVINSGTFASPTPFQNITATLTKAGRYAVRQWVIDLDKMAGDAGFASDTCIAFFSVLDNFAPTLSNLPQDTTVNVDGGCQFVYIPSTPDVVDNCSLDSLNYRIVRNPGMDTVYNASTPAGNTTFQAVFGDTIGVEYSYFFYFRDPSGNVSTHSYKISVKDTTDPTFITSVYPGASKDTTLTVRNTCDTTYTLPTKRFTIDDNCGGIASVTLDNTELLVRNAANTMDSLVVTTVTLTDTLTVFVFTVTDLSGNQTTDSIRVFKRDVKGPIINGDTPYANIVEFNTPSSCDYVYAVSSLSNVLNVTDNCEIDSVWLDIRLDLASGAAIDSIIGFVPADLANPFSFPFSASKVNDGNGTLNHSVTVRARDIEGNNAMPIGTNNTFNISVTDTIRPQIFLDDTLTYFVNSADCQSVTILSTDSRAAIFNQGFGSVADNCADDAILFANMTNSNPASALAGDSLFGNFPLGSTTVTFTTTDGNGNAFSNSLVVNVIDTIAPDAVADVVLLNTNDSTCTATATITSPVTIDDDNCGVDSVAYSLDGVTYIGLTAVDASFEATFQIDTTVVFWRSFDAAGNQTDFTTLVIVTDNTAPTIMLSNTNLQYFTDASSCDREITLPAATVFDNCGIDSVVSSLIITEGMTVDTLTFVNTPVVNFFKRSLPLNPIAYRLETYAVDINGNQSNTIVNTVSLRDTINPTITPIDTVFVDTEVGSCTYEIVLDSLGQAFGLNANDVCGINSITYREVLPAVTQSFNDTVFDAVAGTYTFDITALDSSLNDGNYRFVIVVRNSFENRLLDAPEDTVRAFTLANECSRNVTFDSLTFTNCGDRFTLVSSVPNGTLFELGNTDVTWFVRGNGGDTLFTYDFVVNVADTQAPVIRQAPNDITLYVGSDCNVQYNYVLDVQDNCDAQGLQVETSVPSGSVLSVGTFTNSFTVTDESGNAVSGSNTITVLDTISPRFNNFPSNITSCNPVVNFDIEGIDNCLVDNVQLIAGQASGSTFPLGTTTVTYTVTDASGNTFTQSFVVEILNPATAANAGSDANICITNTGFSLSGNALAAGETGTWTVNPGNATLADANSPTTGVTFPSAGAYTFTWTIDNGNCAPNSDQVVVVVSEEALADAGVDQVVDQPNANLDGVALNGSITWTANTSATINSPNNERTVVSGLTEGDNIFTFTVSNATCGDATDQVTITYTPEDVILEDIRETIPGGFTPNGDGVNDTWNIPRIGEFPNATLLIVNRNGNTVFETNNPSTEEWDGTNEGDELPTASYYYIINLGDGSNPIEGSVTIIK